MKYKRYALILFCILHVSFIVACKETPEDKSIIGKKESLVDKATEIDDTYEYASPEGLSFKTTTKDGLTSIEVDASIEINPNAKYGIYRVSPVSLSQDDADRIIHGLFDDSILYYPKTENEWSKEDYEKAIIEAKSGFNSDFKEVYPDEYEEYIKPEIERLEAGYKNAPDTYIPKVCDGKFITPEFRTTIDLDSLDDEEKDIYNAAKKRAAEQRVIDVEVENGKDVPARLTINTDLSNPRNQSIIYRSVDSTYSGIFEGLVTSIDSQAASIKLSAEEAQKEIELLLGKMGIDHLSLALVGLIPSGLNTQDYIRAETYEELDKCYVFYYTPMFNNVGTNYSSANLPPAQGFDRGVNSYAPIWKPELLKIYVDDNGILGFDYISPRFSDNLNEVFEGVELMPFDIIKSRSENQLSIAGSWMDYGNTINRNVVIDRIKLGYIRISSGEQIDDYIYVPAWDFYGTSHAIYEEEGEEKEMFDKDLNYSLLTINAIDGSVIDRSQGY